ncbi:MAG: hypothetical protein WC714_18110 [Candidatus Obscuribacterales bacterium]|jgi:hypothetical protein
MFKAIKVRLDRHLAWPTKRFFVIYSIIAVAFSLYAASGLIFSDQPADLSLAPRLGAACLLSLVTLFAAAILYLELAFFYRIVLDVIAAWKKFRAWLPGAIVSAKSSLQKAGRASAAAIKFVLGLPAATVRLIARLRLPTGKEVFMSFMMISGFAIAGAIGYLFWPLATKIALAMPSWLPGSARDSSDFFVILLVDMMLSCLPYAIALSLWSSLLVALARRFKNNSSNSQQDTK